MNDWYLFSLVALVLFGIQRFLYKVSAEERCDSALTTFSFMGTVTVFSSCFFLAAGETTADPLPLLTVSLVNSLSFFAGTIATIEALRRIPAATAMPFIRLNAVLVVLFGIFYFGDTLSRFQYLGIILSMGVIIFLARSTADPTTTDRQQTGRGLLFALLALVSGAVAAISSAFAALYVNKLAFIALSYLMGTIFSVALYRTRGAAKGDAAVRKSMAIGAAIGIVNFAGFYSLLEALERGPVSIVIPVTGLYFVVAVILSVIVYREKLDAPRIGALVMTIAAIILIRI